MNTPTSPGTSPCAQPETQPPPDAPSGFSGWLVSSMELLCGLSVVPLQIDPTEPGWREVFGLAPL